MADVLHFCVHLNTPTFKLNLAILQPVDTFEYTACCFINHQRNNVKLDLSSSMGKEIMNNNRQVPMKKQKSQITKHEGREGVETGGDTQIIKMCSTTGINSSQEDEQSNLFHKELHPWALPFHWCCSTVKIMWLS